MTEAGTVAGSVSCAGSSRKVSRLEHGLRSGRTPYLFVGRWGFGPSAVSGPGEIGPSETRGAHAIVEGVRVDAERYGFVVVRTEPAIPSRDGFSAISVLLAAGRHCHDQVIDIQGVTDQR